MPHVILEAEEANAVPTRPYTRTVKLERRVMATLMAHYQRGPHCRGRALKKGLALTQLEGW